MAILKKTRTGVIILSAAIAAAGFVPVYADTNSTEIENAQAASDAAQDNLSDVNEKISLLESKKGEAEDYLTELNSQMTSLTGQIEDLQEKYAENQKQADLVSQQLSDAEKDEKVQRENMELRIQYMYENGSGLNGLTSVLSGDSFTDILNASSNINELEDYDRKALEDYNAVCEEIETKQKQLQKEQKRLEKLTDESNSKKAELTELYNATKSDVESYAASLAGAKESQNELLNNIAEQQAKIVSLTASAAQQVADAEASSSIDDSAKQASQMTVMTESAQNKNTADNADSRAQNSSESTASQSAGTAASSGSETVTSSGTSSSANSAGQSSSSSAYSGSALTKAAGRIQGPSGGETYYNLDMSGVVNIMRNMGNNDKYWVRDDGVKMLGDYVMVAANLETHPRGSIVDSSLGKAIVVDTGGFAASNPQNLDIATSW